jgi:hypothetical protein
VFARADPWPALGWPILAPLFAADAVLVALHIGSKLILGRIPQLVDLDAEGNLPSWWSSAQLLVAGALVAVMVVRNCRTDRRAWILAGLSALLIAMSADEAASFHERFGAYLDLLIARKGSLLSHTGYWPLIIGVPAIAMIGYTLWMCGSIIADGRGCLGRFIAGLAVLFSGAIGVELLNNFKSIDLGDAFEVLEEGLEMLGGSLLVWAAFSLVRRHRSTEAAIRLLRPQ